ncbi:beta-ketoacyl synthase N-terminal-like domain-containing protein [Abyssisolibacter fermentans]|uniref:beta-ketoacyl synthase N-terminal-like domain-containing protein n=1 Tax=Abyssisolibacter fermentans TaxID=1766203 RepID=UPI00082B5408|nr:beta-ketoacyl synthase N-terminal-like domain-containing protein [Abyssisolibacter fermentans]
MNIYCQSYGLITPFGNGVNKLWDAIKYSKTIKNTNEYGKLFIRDNKSVTEVINLLCEDSIRETLRRIDISEKSIANNKRVGLIVASSLGAVDLGYSSENKKIDDRLKNYGRINSITANLVAKFKISGYSTTVTNTCVSGASALLIVEQLLKNDILDQCFIVGFDYISGFISDGLECLKILNKGKTMNYFSDNKQGILLGEGVGTLLIGKNYLPDSNFRIKSSVITNDSYDILKPCKSGQGLKLAIKKAIKKSKYKWSDLDIICFCSNGTKIIDEVNDKLLNYIFDCYNVQAKVTSIKHLIGHTLGASNIIELIALFLMMENHYVPTITANITNTKISKDIYSNKFANSRFEKAMLFSSGFTGVNCCIVLEGIN